MLLLTSRLSLLVAAVLALSALAAPAARAQDPTVDDAGLDRFYNQQLDWQPCSKDLQCAWLTVPLDYSDPGGRTIRLWVTKVPASGPADQRLGSLQVHPGGPGASAAAFAQTVALLQGRELAKYYDIVGFDTRGVGKSRPVKCFTGPELTAWLESDQSPDTPAEERRLMSLAAKVGPECLQRTGLIARNLGSDNTVQDMDVLRQVLGEEKLNYLGFSYGTYVGAQYAEWFPDRVGRLVLDGALDPSLDLVQVTKGQSDGMQLALRRFAENCSARPNCPFPGSTDDVLKGISTTFDRLEKQPLPASKGRFLTQSEAISATITGLYSRPQWWPVLRAAFRETTQGKGTTFLNLFDYANERNGPDDYGNDPSAFLAISCWDQTAPPGRAGLAASAEEWAKTSAVPSMARTMAWGNAPCSGWFGHGPLAERRPVTSTTTAPILIVGTRWDPATPYEWSVALNKQLSTSVLLTSNTDGHTSYGPFSKCVTKYVDAFLISDVVPAPGTSCP